MIVKSIITNNYVHILKNGSKEDYMQEIIQTKYNININIRKINQVKLIQDTLKKPFNNSK